MTQDALGLAEELEKLVATAEVPFRFDITVDKTKEQIRVRNDAASSLVDAGFAPGKEGDYPLVPYVVAALRSLAGAVESFDAGEPWASLELIERFRNALALARSLEEGT